MAALVALFSALQPAFQAASRGDARHALNIAAIHQETPMKTATRKLTAALTCLALLMGQMSLANARLGSSRPTPAGARPAPSGAQYQSPGRLGSGQSAGMQRPQVMQSTRTPPPAAPVQQAVPAPVAPVAPGPGTPGWVKPALAGAAVGALAGYALSNHNTGAGNGAVNSNDNGNGNGNAGVNSNAAGGALATAPVSSGLGGFTGLLLLLLLAGAAFFLWKKYRAGNLLRSAQGGYGAQGYSGQGHGSAPAFPPAPSLGGSANLLAPAGLAPLEAFRSLQDFNSTGNKEALRQVTTPGMFAELEASMGSAPLRILTLNASVQDVTEEPQQTVASVRYTGEVTEGVNPPEPIDEVWHFVLPRSSHAVWQLAGIEQV